MPKSVEVAGDNLWIGRIEEGGFLALPEEVLNRLGWTEETELESLVITADTKAKQLVIRKKDALKHKAGDLV